MDIRNMVPALAFVAAAALSPHGNAAGLFRAYLASDGLDANPCTLTQPCRLLPAALAAVTDGGEIWMLDSANFNTATVNVTKSVTILAIPGALGSVVVTGGPAISIATVGVSVSLRNLVIVPLPAGGGTYGISMTDGDFLSVENCLIAHTPQSGIRVATSANVQVADSTVRNSTSGEGIELSDGATATITRVVVTENSGAGIYVWGKAAGTTSANVMVSTLARNFNGAIAESNLATATAKLTVSDSLVNRNRFGLSASSSAGGPAVLTASNNSISAGVMYGITGSGAGTKVFAAGNTVTDNSIGLVQAGTATFETSGNNSVRNNTSANLGTITVVTMQ